MDVIDLKYLHEREFSINDEIVIAAAENGHLNCLEFFRYVGYRTNLTAFFSSELKKHPICCDYISKNLI